MNKFSFFVFTNLMRYFELINHNYLDILNLLSLLQY